MSETRNKDRRTQRQTQRKRKRQRQKVLRSMNALPRSSISFRRQGSSGLIWEDRVQVLEQKPALQVTISINKSDSQEHTSNLDERFQERKDVDSPSPPLPETSVPSKSEKKDRGCSFSILFGRCMRSPAA
ncbi:unnamed protein product [Prunus brigantina]